MSMFVWLYNIVEFGCSLVLLVSLIILLLWKKKALPLCQVLNCDAKQNSENPQE